MVIQILLLGLTYWYESYDEALTPDQLHWQIIILIDTLNHSLNFILYIISGQQFRTQFFKMITCNRKCADGHSYNSNNISTTTKQVSCL